MLDSIIDIFRTPSVEVLAQREFEEARRCLLMHQRRMDYYESLANFQGVRIARLKTLLKTEAEARNIEIKN